MNLEKLDEAIAYIEAHPEEHDQRVWIRKEGCGTAACLAGTAVLLDGWKPVDWDLDFLDRVTAGRVEKDGARDTVVSTARRILGLTEDQADALFYHGNDLDDIKHYRDEIVAGAL